MQEARQKAGFAVFSGGLKENCRGDLWSPARVEAISLPIPGAFAPTFNLIIPRFNLIIFT